MRTNRIAASLALVVTLGLAAGCATVPSTSGTSPDPNPTSDAPTESATPSPVARPDLAPETLELGFEGLGSLRLGESPESSDLVEWDPDYCLFPEAPADQGELGRWIAVGDFAAESRAPFSVSAVAGVIDAIELRTDDLTTDRGIRYGSSLAELESAYPELSLFETGQLSTVHHVTEAGATMVFEVASDDAYWAPEDVATVTGIVVAPQELGQRIGARSASDNVVGGCL